MTDDLREAQRATRKIKIFFKWLILPILIILFLNQPSDKQVQINSKMERWTKENWLEYLKKDDMLDKSKIPSLEQFAAELATREQELFDAGRTDNLQYAVIREKVHILDIESKATK